MEARSWEVKMVLGGGIVAVGDGVWCDMCVCWVGIGMLYKDEMSGV